MNDICAIDIGDNVTFEVSSISSIMDEFEYPGIRIQLAGCLGKIRQPFKIDMHWLRHSGRLLSFCN